MNALLESGGDVEIVSRRGVSAGEETPEGVVIRNTLSGSGAVSIDVDGTDFRLVDGARISGDSSLAPPPDVSALPIVYRDFSQSHPDFGGGGGADSWTF